VKGRVLDLTAALEASLAAAKKPSAGDRRTKARAH